MKLRKTSMNNYRAYFGVRITELFSLANSKIIQQIDFETRGLQIKKYNKIRDKDFKFYKVGKALKDKINKRYSYFITIPNVTATNLGWKTGTNIEWKLHKTKLLLIKK